MNDRHDLIDGQLKSIAPEARQEALAIMRERTAKSLWVPNPGPQTDAYICEADELFYGGQAGGGKTDLGLGLALTAHQRGLICAASTRMR